MANVRLVSYLFLATGLYGADENAVALALRAQADFDRVDTAAVPRLPETMACIQSQAAALPVTRTIEVPLIHYRRGFCRLLGAATITKNRDELRDAARELDRAVSDWPLRSKDPVPSGLRILADAAHLKADGNSDPRVAADLEAAVNQGRCPATDMPSGKCQALLDAGRLWLSWIAARERRFADAARWTETLPESAWDAWAKGRLAAEARNFKSAVALYRTAVDRWAQPERPGLAAWIGPEPDRAEALYQFALAQYATKECAAAIASLDASVKLRPKDFRAIFLRGRARELCGQSGLDDFELASRTAYANDGVPGASGQAHLYKGVAMFRRGDYTRAEQEFASALNFDPGSATPDARAWWHMAAVAAGSCDESARRLEQGLADVSGVFPGEEAASLLRKCPVGARTASGPSQPSAR